MRLVLLGPPGVGKGTLAGLLKESLGVLHISTGDIFREEMKNNTALGKEIKGYIDKGQLVPDEVVTRIIESRLKADSKVKEGFLLDGFPRTKKQAQDLDKILSKLDKPIDYVLYLQATLKTVVQRLTGRRVCKSCSALFHIENKPPQKEGVCDECGGELYQRPDDNLETIKTRMDVYLKNLKPILDYYKVQHKLKMLDANKESEEVYEILIKSFHEDRKRHKH